MPSDALIRFSKEFNIPLDSPDITNILIREITKIKQEVEIKKVKG